MDTIEFGSVSSGIEAASVAWHGLGWRAAWLSEIAPFPSAVLAHHYPDAPNLGDMTTLPKRIASGEVSAPDVFCGGTPCQAFSVAGLRKSLDDERGNLSLVFCEIANEIDTVRSVQGKPAAVIFWENVPGVLNTSDNAFGHFLAGLAGEDDPLVPAGKKWTNAGCVFGPKRTVAWRVLDAQYFGLAQRRRRVFVVASARDGFDPAKVLFEFDGLRRDTPPSREAREGVTHATAPCLTSSGPGVERTGDTRGQDPVVAVAFHPTQDPISSTDGSTHALGCGSSGGQASVAIAIRTAQTGSNGWGINTEGTAYTLDSAQQAVAVSIRGREGGATAELGDEVGNCLRASQGGGDKAHVLAPVAYTTKLHNTGSNNAGKIFCERSTCLDANSPPPALLTASQVRRLTPTECERLQGFPDGYTAIPWRKKPASECPDGPRYKALGNSWAVPVVRWIGSRINKALQE